MVACARCSIPRPFPQVSGLKVNRNYHLLSDLEFAYFVVLEFSEDVVDIREQYPLLPTSDLQQIAHARSIRYPKFAGTDLPYVLTTDFLVTYKASNGTTQLAARTVKYSDALQASASLERTLQKLEIERCFWLEQGADWGIVTEKSIPAALSENLQWLRQSAVVDKGLQQPGIQQRFMDALDRLNSSGSHPVGQHSDGGTGRQLALQGCHPALQTSGLA